MLRSSFRISDGKLTALTALTTTASATGSGGRSGSRWPTGIGMHDKRERSKSIALFVNPAKAKLFCSAVHQRFHAAPGDHYDPSDDDPTEPSTPCTTSGKGHKRQRRVSSSPTTLDDQDVIDLEDDSGQTDATGQTGRCLEYFASKFLHRVESASCLGTQPKAPAALQPKKASDDRPKRIRKRKIEFGVDKAFTEFNVVDVLDAIDRPESRFNIRVVPNVTRPTTSRVLTSLPFAVGETTTKARLAWINRKLRDPPRMPPR